MVRSKLLLWFLIFSCILPACKRSSNSANYSRVSNIDTILNNKNITDNWAKKFYYTINNDSLYLTIYADSNIEKTYWGNITFVMERIVFNIKKVDTNIHYISIDSYRGGGSPATYAINDANYKSFLYYYSHLIYRQGSNFMLDSINHLTFLNAELILRKIRAVVQTSKILNESFGNLVDRYLMECINTPQYRSSLTLLDYIRRYSKEEMKLDKNNKLKRYIDFYKEDSVLLDKLNYLLTFAGSFKNFEIPKKLGNPYLYPQKYAFKMINN